MKLFDEEFYRQRVNAFPFVRLMGMKLLSSQQGKSVMQCRIRSILRNTAGTLHGGVMGALVDMSVATALRSVMPLSSKMTTVEYKVNFLRPVAFGKVTAYGAILRLGKTIAVGASEIRNDGGGGRGVRVGDVLPRQRRRPGRRRPCYNRKIRETKDHAKGQTMTREEPIRPDMFLGEVLREYPAVRDKVRELFGTECLRCRSSQKETLIYTSWHKGLDPKTVCRELNAVVKGR